VSDQIVVNGVSRAWQPGLTLGTLIAELSTSTKGFAVAVDREVVPRSSWATTLVEPGVEIEIVTAAAGG
jgi:sulfur carrier protein